MIKTGMPQIQKNQTGFTLLEAAIIITVLSLIMAPFFGYLANRHSKRELVKQEEAHKQITAALAVFVAENNRYPCPADPALPIDNTAFGFEVACAGTGVVQGALPVRTLRLPASAAFNRYGWQYMYAVDQEEAGRLKSASPLEIIVQLDVNDNGILGETSPGTNDDDITDTNSDGIPDSPNLFVPFMIVNPGKDGKGSRNDNGGATPLVACGTTAFDSENCDGNTLFYDLKPSPQNNTALAAHYDDTLIYSLAREESTFWQVDSTIDNNGTANISTRAGGGVGIGVATPNAGTKLHINNGNLRVNGDTTNATDRVNVMQDVNTTLDVQIDGNLEGTTTGQGVDAVGAGGAFYYP